MTSIEHVGVIVNNNGGVLACECSWMQITLNFLINQHISILLEVYEQNMSLVRIAAFIEGDNTLGHIFHSLNVLMEISIADLTF